MSIDYDTKTLAPVITIGDGDVLIGCTAVPRVVRFWMAPRAENDGLATNEVTPAKDCTPPGNEAVTVYFVSRAALDGFIKMLSLERDKAFPEKSSD